MTRRRKAPRSPSSFHDCNSAIRRANGRLERKQGHLRPEAHVPGSQGLPSMVTGEEAGGKAAVAPMLEW